MENLITILNNLYFRHQLSARLYREAQKHDLPEEVKSRLSALTRRRARMADGMLEHLKEFPAPVGPPGDKRWPYLKTHWGQMEDALRRKDSDKIKSLCWKNEQQLVKYLKQTLARENISPSVRRSLQDQLQHLLPPEDPLQTPHLQTDHI